MTSKEHSVLPVWVRFIIPYPLNLLGLPNPEASRTPASPRQRETTQRASRPVSLTAAGLIDSTTPGNDPSRGSRWGRYRLASSTQPAEEQIDPLRSILAERTNRQNASASGSNNATTRRPGVATGQAGRGRRGRRTASQRSTHSLPLYSEDAGEEDVVLIR